MILIIGVFVILVIGGWIVWDVVENGSSEDSAAEQIPVKQAPAVSEAAAVLAEKAAPEDIQAMNLQVLATVFAEKFGTYSNHDVYQSLLGAKLLETASMVSWTDSYVVEMKKKHGDDSSAYYGITTKALNSSVSQVSADSAVVMVGCQRKESSYGLPEILYNQALKLEFKKINNEWKVDGAYWQNKEI